MGGKIARAEPAIRFLPSLGTRATDLAFSPDGRWLAAHGRTHRCVVYDLRAGELVHQLAHERQLWGAPTFSADSMCLLTSGLDGARLWQLPDGRPLGAHAGMLVDATVVGDRLVAVHKNGTIETIAIAGWRSLDRVATGVASTCHTVSPDGRYVLVVGHQPPVVALVWDVENHAELVRLDDDAIGWAAFGGPECRTLATIRSFVGHRPPHPLQLRELPRKKAVQRSRDTAYCAALAPDGSRYAYATGTHVALCDAYGKELDQLEVGIACAALAFDARGERLAAGSQNGGVTLWTIVNLRDT